MENTTGNDQSRTEYDMLIIGGGAAGLAAAIYAGRYGMKSAIISPEIGGATALAGEIENYPGFIGTGRELIDKFKEQAEKFGTKFIIGEARSVKREGDMFTVETNNEPLSAKTVMAGLGSKHRKLGIPGEDDFFGKGVSVCATCDGNFFKGKRVAVIGGGDAAAKAILYLSEICEKVQVSYRREPLKTEPIYIERIEKKDNVEIVYNSVPEKIEGNQKVTGVKLKPFGEKKISNDHFEVDGVFVEIGADPILEPFSELGLELDGNAIKVDKESRTNVEGFYAAGDGTNNPFKQTVTAAAAGSIAAKSAYDYLQEKHMK